MFKHYYYAEFDIHKDMYVVKKRLHICGILMWGIGLGPYEYEWEAQSVADEYNYE